VSAYLPSGLPQPVPAGDGLDREYWEGTRLHELRIQRCNACRGWQWGPEWICHRCHSFDLGFEAVEGTGVLFATERVWHPVHPALVDAVPYVVALVELPQADGVRVVGNLIGDPLVDVAIGAAVTAVFEDHDDAAHPYTLVHWRAV
jgi:uncharacterized protein